MSNKRVYIVISDESEDEFEPGLVRISERSARKSKRRHSTKKPELSIGEPSTEKPKQPKLSIGERLIEKPKLRIGEPSAEKPKRTKLRLGELSTEKPKRVKRAEHEHNDQVVTPAVMPGRLSSDYAARERRLRDKEQEMLETIKREREQNRIEYRKQLDALAVRQAYLDQLQATNSPTIDPKPEDRSKSIDQSVSQSSVRSSTPVRALTTLSRASGPLNTFTNTKKDTSPGIPIDQSINESTNQSVSNDRIEQISNEISNQSINQTDKPSCQDLYPFSAPSSPQRGSLHSIPKENIVSNIPASVSQAILHSGFSSHPSLVSNDTSAQPNRSCNNDVDPGAWLTRLDSTSVNSINEAVMFMSRNRKSVEVQAAGLKALRNMLSISVSRSCFVDKEAGSAPWLSNMSIIAPLIIALRHEADALCSGFQLLIALVRSCSTRLSNRIYHLVSPQFVLAAAKKHMVNRNLVLQATELLVLYANFSGANRWCSNHEYRVYCFTIFDKYSEDRAMLIASLDFLVLLVAIGEVAKSFVLLGGITKLENIICRFPLNRDIQRSAFNVVSILASRRVAHLDIGMPTFMQTLLCAASSGDAEIVGYCASIISEIHIPLDVKYELARSGFVDFVVNAMKQSKLVLFDSLQSFGCAALLKLAVNTDEYFTQLIFDSDVCSHLIALLQDPVVKHQIKRYATQILRLPFLGQTLAQIHQAQLQK